MRAVVIEGYGGPEVLQVAEVAQPQPGPGQVQVRVRAAAVHPADGAARAGVLAALVPERERYVLGWDFAGEVAELGAGVSGYAVGDAVVGLSDWFETLVGTQAEYVVLDATALAPAPVGTSAVDAAGLPLNGLTALQALPLLGLAPGQSLLVTGAAGGVGAFAVELAVRSGLVVYALAGPDDEKFVTGLGATLVPRSADPVAALRELVPAGVDGVLDAAVLGPPVLGAVRDGGSFVAVVGPAAPTPERDIRVGKVSVHSGGTDLADLVDLVQRGELTLRTAGTYPVEQVAQAHTRLAAGGVRGALVLTIGR